jgi:hypothetical protein
MATFDTVEYAKQVAVPPTALDTTEQAGRVRIVHFDTGTIDAAQNDLINLIKMPAGNVRILALRGVKPAYGAGATLDIGHTGYTNLSGTAVVASEAAFVAALDVAAAGDLDKVIDVQIQSRGGFTVQAKLEGANPASGQLKGWLEYVVD